MPRTLSCIGSNRFWQGLIMEQSIPLPELWQGYLDHQQLLQYVDDLETHAEIFSIQIKQSPHQMVTSEPGYLKASVAGVESGDIFAVQVRYGYQGREWCDTLMKHGDAIKLIRMSHEMTIQQHESTDSLT